MSKTKQDYFVEGAAMEAFGRLAKSYGVSVSKFSRAVKPRVYDKLRSGVRAVAQAWESGGTKTPLGRVEDIKAESFDSLIEGLRQEEGLTESGNSGPFGGVSFADGPRKGSARYIKEVLEAAIRKQLSHPSMVSMFRKWIEGSLYSGHGDFILRDISRAKFKYVNKDDASFTADVVVALSPDYERTAKKKYVWKMTGKRYRGVIK